MQIAGRPQDLQVWNLCGQTPGSAFKPLSLGVFAVAQVWGCHRGAGQEPSREERAAQGLDRQDLGFVSLTLPLLLPPSHSHTRRILSSVAGWLVPHLHPYIQKLP